jgi:hypothetical protein
MTIAGEKSTTQKLPLIRRTGMGDAEVTSKIAIQPVFVDDGGRRKRLLVAAGYLAALACVGYMVVVAISLTAGPAGQLSDFTGPLSALAAPVATEVADPPEEVEPRETPEAPAAPLPAAVHPVAAAPIPAATSAPAVVVPVVPAATPAPVVQTPAPAPATSRPARTREPRASSTRQPNNPPNNPPSTQTESPGPTSDPAAP